MPAAPDTAHRRGRWVELSRQWSSSATKFLSRLDTVYRKYRTTIGVDPADQSPPEAALGAQRSGRPAGPGGRGRGMGPHPAHRRADERAVVLPVGHEAAELRGPADRS